MHIHVLGICGTFMGGIALLARALGHQVSGSDANVYPPMSTQLAAAGIHLCEGYRPEHLQPPPDCVLVGNAMSRGNPAVEYLLDSGLPYVSGPQWLAEHVLHDRWVLAVAGTHGKTTTSGMLAWILEAAGLDPGFLIGGVPQNFGISARLGTSPYFVVEADEYDTAFFDKRSKFVHYRPRTLVINNIEFDHADIFDDLAMIQRQFHHLLRTVPGRGRVLVPVADPAVDEVLAMGLWTPSETFGVSAPAYWHCADRHADSSDFAVFAGDRPAGRVRWELLGEHNVNNALAALAAAHHAGVPASQGVAALAGFRNVKRRLELFAEVAGVRVYDDFAHHPTAIRTTLAGLRQRVGGERIVAVLEPRSNTMRLGVHSEHLGQALQAADQVVFYAPASLRWDARPLQQELGARGMVLDSVGEIVERLAERLRPGDHVLVMSNGGFEGIHPRLVTALEQRQAPPPGDI
jgi:UDP-N-acetylmuramate: L-alanyl-gamma-D-glutamyl-meso-diaminopimelate ligase